MSKYLSEEDLIRVIKEFEDWEAFEWRRQDVIDYVIHDDTVKIIEIED